MFEDLVSMPRLEIRHLAIWLATGSEGLSLTVVVAFGSGSFRKLGVPYFGVLIIRILLFRVLY